jgi:hypothetical protein
VGDNPFPWCNQEAWLSSLVLASSPLGKSGIDERLGPGPWMLETYA